MFLFKKNNNNNDNNNNKNNDIKLNKHFSILEEFHRASGVYNSEQVREFIDKYIDESISSTSKLLNGNISSRNSKDDVHTAWMAAYNGKWRHELIDKDKWSVSSKGDIDTLCMTYKLIIPRQDNTIPYVMYFNQLAEFNNITGLWIKSVYTQFTPESTIASKNKHFPILEEFHRASGVYNSEQARVFIDKYIDESISSASKLLNGNTSTRSSKDEVHKAWMTALNGKWRHELIDKDQWTASTDGAIDTLCMTYKLIIPREGNTPYIMHFHQLTQFNNITGLWIKSAYNEFKPEPSTASKVGSTIAAGFKWYLNHTSNQLDKTLDMYGNIMNAPRSYGSSSSSSSSSSNDQYQRNRNREIQDHNNYVNQQRQQQEQREREYKQSLIR